MFLSTGVLAVLKVLVTPDIEKMTFLSSDMQLFFKLKKGEI